MKLNIPATRMELMRLRKRYDVAFKGHKMLKDKLDELIRLFLELVEKNQGFREEIETKLMDALDAFTLAKGSVHDSVLYQAVTFNNSEVYILKKEKQVLNLRVPEFEVKEEGDIHSYGFEDTSVLLDASLSLFRELLPDMVKLAELEKSIQIMAEEIETTRRRVNALEYILIPNLEETIWYIRMKLEERERSALTRLMKIKDIIQSK
ncbi:V-type ATP synthase subunit D [Planctomycetota bacterium]